MIVTCKNNHFEDATTLSWHTPISHTPLIYGICLATKRKSLEIIKESKEFCINFLTEDQSELAMYCGSNSGHTIDKFKEGKIKKESCDTIDCPRIKECSAYLECTLHSLTEIGDHILVAGLVKKTIEGNNKKKLLQSNIKGPYTFTTTKD